MITAAIFDLDGLLTDTEKLHCQAYQQALAEVGFHLHKEQYLKHWVRSGLTISDFVRAHGLKHDPSVLRERKSVIYEQLVRTKLRPMPGALELLERLRGNLRLALATSSRDDSAQCVLRELGIAHYFEVIATEGSVARLKPHPDIFLFVAEKLGVSPGECVVLEDAEKGILAAHAAGMKSIAVPNEFTKDNDFTLATKVVQSLHEITPELLASL